MTRQDCLTLVELISEITGHQPKMWGASIIGFGSYHYKYASGLEGDWLLVGFSPRKQNLTLYLLDGSEEENELLKKLGRHSTGKSCLYIKRLDDIHLPALKKLITQSYKRKTKMINR